MLSFETFNIPICWGSVYSILKFILKLPASNASTQILFSKSKSFKNVVDNNTQRQALTRVRNAGSAVPAKKIHKYANAPAIY